MAPVPATAIPAGSLNCPCPKPDDPNWNFKLPPLVITTTRLLPVSAI